MAALGHHTYDVNLFNIPLSALQVFGFLLS